VEKHTDHRYLGFHQGEEQYKSMEYFFQLTVILKPKQKELTNTDDWK
jgi:hypothetical protein